MQLPYKSSQTIRQEFFSFFESKNHTLIPSASLVPENDQTLLFTNAGMNQFKDVFLNTGTRPYSRAVDTQKVMRVSGKHNDFNDVGRDTYHHTFFEMLGNWSFGDYYKLEAITWAWELLTKVWNLPIERLYATVYNSDNESYNIWLSSTNINPSNILRFGEEYNFWEMGTVGPCGPCSEIHIDLTPDLTESIGAGGINNDNPLFIELWNLVFIQYNRQEDGSLLELPKKHVDTGMGLERITAVLQNQLSNYNTDLFDPIISHISQETSIPYQEGASGTAHRVVADHIRSLTFAINDGIIPSNEGRGYVIRKILRRAIRFGRDLGYTKPFLYQLVPIIATIMKEPFPLLLERQESIQAVIKAEESSFFCTLNKGYNKIRELINNTKANNNTIISGSDVFLLYDSMGFPIDFTEQLLKDENLSYDKEQFDLLMLEQKKRARASWKGEGINFTIFGKQEKTIYIEDNNNSKDVRILAFVKANQLVDSVQAGDDIALILDKTLFYGEKGGQIGDQGIIGDAENIIEIFDTKIFEEKYIHLGKVTKGTFLKGQLTKISIDNTRKKNIARNHSAAHLLFLALRNILGNHIGQAGSWIGDIHFRIDFTHPQALTTQELDQIELFVNTNILTNHKTNITEMPINQAKANGAIAAFEEKYGEIVRVVTIGDSIELCGGTHINYSGELGLFAILHESSVSSGTRRIEAVVGQAAYHHYKQYINVEKHITQILKCSNQEILPKLEKVIEEYKEKDRTIKKLNTQLAKDIFNQLLEDTYLINDITIISAKVPEDMINEIPNYFRDKVKNSIMILGTLKKDQSAIISISISKELSQTIKAGDLIKQFTPIIGGKGGGRPDHAMAGGKDGNQLDLLFTQIKDILSKNIK